jgi:GntR family transcriptional repressor for pyruvate dehydrogenase complex
MAKMGRGQIIARGGRSSALRPIKRESLNQQIFSRLEAYLEQGHLKVGSQLPSERQLATLLGVSRPSIREVLKALSILGIVKSRQGQGTYLVTSFGTLLERPDGQLNLRQRVDLVEVAEARSTIEPIVASLAAVRASDQELREINRELEAMRGSVKDGVLFLQHDLQCHRLILKACGNVVLQRMLAPALEHLYSYRQKLKAYGDRQPRMLKFHENVVRALRSRDSRAARRAMSQHMKEARAFYLRLSRTEPQKDDK